MAEVAYSTIASAILRNLNAPDNAGTNLAVQTWIKRESGGNIIGNNPLNIHYDVARSYGIQPDGRWWSSGDQAWVASFSSLDRGAAATANILNRDIHGYKKASDSLRANDPIGFLRNIAASNWAASHYGGGDPVKGAASLIASFQAAGGQITGTVSTVDPSGALPSGVSLATILRARFGATGDVYKDTDPLTQEWKNTIERAIKGDGTIFAEGIPGLTGAQKDAIWKRVDPLLVVGKPIGQILIPADIATKLGVSASGGFVGIGPTDPNTGESELVPALYDVPEFLGKVGSFLFDPANWLYMLGLGVGIALVGYGIVVVIRSYSGQTATVGVS